MMKEAHVKNIAERAARVTDLIENPDRLARLLKRIDPDLRGTDVKRSTEDLVRLVQEDLPELITALREEKQQVRNLQAALRRERDV